ncbi:MAG: group II intron reverse transcriptase/maturase [Planctomycetota bacterium]
MMEAICNPENMSRAYGQVLANKGAGGVDGMTVQQLRDYLKAHWPDIREQLLGGAYKPRPVRRVEIPKPDGGVRTLGIPTVLDRLIQQAILQVLTPLWEPTFSTHSYGFRPKRSAHQAVAAAQAYIAEGRTWVVDLDLEKFFDRVNHDRLMARLAWRVGDKRLLRLIRAYLNAGVMEDGLVSPTTEGTPQGGPLSPLLSNIVLDELDRELEHRGHAFVRYADDCNIYVRSEKAGQRVMKSVSDFITRRLQLKVNESKSAVDRPSRRKFLGFTIAEGAKPQRRIAPQARKRFREKVRELTRRTRGVNAKQMASALTVYLRGWVGYFGFCETPWELRDLDGWIRRRLRAVAWKHWKRGPTRCRELMRRGISRDDAVNAAWRFHNPWRASRSIALSKALPQTLWDRLGLLRLYTP